MNCTGEEKPYSFRFHNSFPREQDSFVTPLILILNEKRVRAAVRFRDNPPLPGLLSSRNSSMDLQQDSIYNPTLDATDGSRTFDEPIPASVRLASLSLAIARQDIEATLYIFLDDDQVLEISSPLLWRARFFPRHKAHSSHFVLPLLRCRSAFPFPQLSCCPSES